MSSGYAGQVPKRSLLRVRRAERLKREIALLSRLDESVWRTYCKLSAVSVLVAGGAMTALISIWLEFSLAATFWLFVCLAGLATGWLFLGWWMFSVPIILLSMAIALSSSSIDVAPLATLDPKERRFGQRRRIYIAIEKRQKIIDRLLEK
jgi:hypothetical protein